MRWVRLGASLGPACDAPEVLRGLLRAGIELARINFSHGDAEAARVRARRLRRAAREAGREVLLLGDLQGPRLRLGTLRGGRLDLGTGATVDLLPGVARAAGGALPLPGTTAGAFRRGLAVLLDDGNVRLRVERVRGSRVGCRVERGGPVSDRKGVHVPGLGIEADRLPAKDRRDLELAAEIRCDALLLSFVRRARDVERVRDLLDRRGRPIPLVAKIECPEAVDRLGEIVDAADGVLVARGDLGAAANLERLPALQRRIVAAAREAGKPAMVAGHLLATMVVADRPARAEVADVAHAVHDGADALILTAETAAGAHPVAAARALARIVEATENRSGTRRWWS